MILDTDSAVSSTEVSISLLCQLLYVQLITQQYKSRTILKSTSVTKVATMKNMDNFCYAKKNHHMQPQINAFHCQQR